MKIRYFESFEEFENYQNKQEEFEEEVIDIVKYENTNRICADLITNCKSYKTVINRLFKGIENYKEFEGWKNDLLESCENDCFKMRDKDIGHWCIENIGDNIWYVELTVTL